ncbi:leucine-rich repeat receptor-like serine/threonine-protein kinase SKM1 [Telopea speciosissima]|uniref:leucine-rich repeat receptor-like serine/threonine-protein kinase SKM1 n=1 Tax=Telopea speciosissima TaxID=54955 RepID=UPI001CC4B2EE|nr:leucine-rich repeat receptor-like serine/threonine-protein kinase SKM1 [Telopea speciosissima]
MDKRGGQAYVLLLVFLLFSSSVVLNGKELELLLSFKASISDPFQFLADWNSNSSFAFCNWHGITCVNSSHVVSIELSGKNISGKLSPSLFLLPSIESIDLSNNELYGQIPLETFFGSSLRHLNLSNNNFTSLVLHGSISGLETLDLSNNMLSGKIPAQIKLFTSLKVLDLGGNVLQGSIPTSIANLKELQFLTLASNQLVGDIPRELGQMKSLKWIYLGYNNLSGEIPKEIGELTSLNHLDLVYNNLTGEIPSSLGNLTDLQYLFLYKNRLTGSITRSMFQLRKLISLDLSDNYLSGQIPELIGQLQNLEILHLFSNNFTGRIPEAVASLPRLQVVQLWSNRLSGEIPKNLGRWSNLTLLDLSTNKLTGKIPESLCNSGRLFKLILFSNFLRGKIPESLCRCRSLQRIRIQNNLLSGELSPEFTKLPLVYFLEISDNSFSGRIDQQRWDTPSLQMLSLSRNKFLGKLPESFGSEKLEKLDFSANSFSGSIPRSFGDLSELVELKLSKNQLNGFIPNELASCKKLVSLDLSGNQLSGPIPVSLSEMPVLGALDLSENKLFGDIPPTLGTVESLLQVNISHNHLHGRLPSTGAFLGINSSAVAGNDLCGGETISGLPPCRTGKKPVWWLLITSFLVVLVVLALSLSVVTFMRRRSGAQLKKVDHEDGTWELQFFDSSVSNAITIDDILLCMKEENVVSKGSEGTSYRGKSSVHDVQFIVMEINDKSVPSTFWVEMTELGKLRHPNIVKLTGICRSEKGGFLIYEFVEGKSLRDVLGGLSWERRKTMAIRIVKALQFLHHRLPSFLIGDLSPEKIIVDGKEEPRLQPCLPGFVRSDCKSFPSSGYIAPEIREKKDITEKSEKGDIYSYGVLLIEILTGKGPADTELGVYDGIVEWARYCYSDCHLDTWIDPAIKGFDSKFQNEVVETMNLALQCTATDPAARPCATDALKILLDCAIRSSSCISGLKFSASI